LDFWALCNPAGPGFVEKNLFAKETKLSGSENQLAR
jgi:hypothetical protein